MWLFVTTYVFLWNIIVNQFAEAGEPTMETSKIQISITQGTTAILPCMINFDDVDTNERRKYAVIWSNNDSRTLSINEKVTTNHRKYFVSHPYPNEWNLQIRQARSTDSGQYKCQVNTNPVQTKLVVLHVRVPPRIHSSERVDVRETERLVVYCNVTGDPAPTVDWYKDDAYMPLFRGEMLVIAKVVRNDSGLYRCEADNGVDPSGSEDITVDVLYTPTVNLYSSRISQYRYKSIGLDCNVVANPVETVTWYKNGRPLEANWKYNIEDFAQSDGSRTHSLVIGYLQRLDFGDYVCMAINKVGSASSVITVTEISTSTIQNTVTTTAAVIKTKTRQSYSQEQTKSTAAAPTWNTDRQTAAATSSSNTLSVSRTILYIPEHSPTPQVIKQQNNLVVVPDNPSSAASTVATYTLLFCVFISMYAR